MTDRFKRARQLRWAMVWILLGCGLGPVVAENPIKGKKPYRVIFNSDGHAVAKDAEGDLEQWIRNLFDPLEESHVDALFWCDGSGGNTANYDSQVLERTGARAGKPRKDIDAWIAAGQDPPKVVVREAKRRGMDVFFSLRVNDIHDSFIPEEMATFKVEHPEWMLGEEQYDRVTSFKSALNFAIPEVRELKFRLIEEIFTKYDFDGLEMDFLRSAPYFLPGMEEENAGLLTQLLRRVRAFLNEQGKKRDRRLSLAVRVDESLAACRRDAFEVETWIREGLVDIVTLGSGVMDMELEEFKRLAADTGVHIYPCLYGWPSKYSPITTELATGLALNYHAQGADGIYLFNWFPHTKNNSESTGPHLAPLLKELGDPQILSARQSKQMFPVDRGRPASEYPNNWWHCVLPAKLTFEQPLELSLRAFPTFLASDSLKLEMVAENLPEAATVIVTAQGKKLGDWQALGGNRYRTSITPDQLRSGRNPLTLSLAKPLADNAGINILAVELHVQREVAAR